MFKPAPKRGSALLPDAGDGGKGQTAHDKNLPLIQGEVSLSRSFFSPRYPHLRVCS